MQTLNTMRMQASLPRAGSLRHLTRSCCHQASMQPEQITFYTRQGDVTD